MKMKCPVCANSELRPTMIEEMLPAMACGVCKGSLVSLLYYRHWAEQHKPDAPAATGEVKVAPTDTATAITCPKCERIMTKFKLVGTVANRLDLCGTCDEAWLDQGEWELLEQLQLSDKLPTVFTDSWQRKLRNEKNEQTRQTILKKTIGEGAASKVEDFRTWLNDQRQKSTILTYLYRD
jgi:Zn-finger nucleic acid-binding protein